MNEGSIDFNMAFFWRRNKKQNSADEGAAAPGRAFSTSVLGLDRSIEELQAEEAALEQELGAKFSREVEKTRNSLN
jgi:hypothetical protein